MAFIQQDLHSLAFNHTTTSSTHITIHTHTLSYTINTLLCIWFSHWFLVFLPLWVSSQHICKIQIQIMWSSTQRDGLVYKFIYVLWLSAAVFTNVSKETSADVSLVYCIYISPMWNSIHSDSWHFDEAPWKHSSVPVLVRHAVPQPICWYWGILL